MQHFFHNFLSCLFVTLKLVLDSLCGLFVAKSASLFPHYITFLTNCKSYLGSSGKRTADEKRQEGKRRRRNGTDTNGAPQRDTNSEDNSGKKSNSNDSDANDSGNKDDSAGSDTSSDRIEEVASDDDDNNWDDGGTKDEDKGDHSDSGKSETDKNHAQTDSIALKPMGVRWSKRLAGDTSHPVLENRNLGTKNRSRQRPICNSALDSVVRQDSDDENSSEHANSEIAGHDELPVTDPEEVGES